jgi:hypothetical protein
MPGPWALRYPGVDAVFSDESGIYLRVAPDLGDYDIVTDDTDNVRGDGSTFGEDFHGGRTLSITFGIVGTTETDMWDRFSKLSAYWNAAAIRTTPGALTELVSDRGRSAFGRPRRIRPTDVFPESRMMTVETTFRTTDKLFYGAPDSLAVPLGLTQGGGLKSPLKSPLVARGSTTAANTFVVLGEEPTWPVLTIAGGAILNPVATVPGIFRYAVPASLRYDDSVVIDTRPGRRSVIKNGTQIASLSRTSSFLDEGALTPGGHTLTLSGSSASGNPTATLEWRAAFPSP